MKMRRLPATDLARNATLPPRIQREALERVYDSQIRVTYNPVRARFQDIFNIGSDLFGPGKPVVWSVLEEVLRKECSKRDDTTWKINRRVAKALHEFSINNRITGHPEDFRGLSMGEDTGGVKLWLSMVLIIDGEPTLMFIDPRLNNGLRADSRQFVFSMMDQGVRQVYLDYADAGMAILQFRRCGDELEVIPHQGQDIDLYSYGELQGMIEQTYGIWRQIYDERQSKARAEPGDMGPLFGS